MSLKLQANKALQLIAYSPLRSFSVAGELGRWPLAYSRSNFHSTLVSRNGKVFSHQRRD